MMCHFIVSFSYLLKSWNWVRALG